MHDLEVLDGVARPGEIAGGGYSSIPPDSLLERAVGDGIDRGDSGSGGHESLYQAIKAKLGEQAFGNTEYLLSLGALSVINAAAWYYILYPENGPGLEQAIRNNGDVRLVMAGLVSHLNPVTLGFAGAYFFSLDALVRRYFAADLYPTAFMQCLQRQLLVLVLALVFGHGCRHRGGGSVNIDLRETSGGSLLALDGISVAIEARLEEERADTIQAMATVRCQGCE